MENPEKSKVGPGLAKPKNPDDAFLKIMKKRFQQVKDKGRTECDFLAYFLGSEFKLPALNPYSERPTVRMERDGKRVPVYTPPKILNMPSRCSSWRSSLYF